LVNQLVGVDITAKLFHVRRDRAVATLNAANFVSMIIAGNAIFSEAKRRRLKNNTMYCPVFIRTNVDDWGMTTQTIRLKTNSLWLKN